MEMDSDDYEGKIIDSFLIIINLKSNYLFLKARGNNLSNKLK